MESKVFRTDRTIFLSGNIDAQSSTEVIMHLLELISEDNRLDKVKKEYVREDINLYIKSDGGVVSDMFSLIDLIESSKTPINTFALGMVGSAAVPLFICGKKRYVYKNTQILIHTSRINNLRGDIQYLSEYMDNWEYVQQSMDKYFISKTNITQSKLKEVRRSKVDWSIYAEEAIKLGVADEII